MLYVDDDSKYQKLYEKACDLYDKESSQEKYEQLEAKYKECLDDAKPRLKAIIDDITGPVYNYFKGYQL